MPQNLITSIFQKYISNKSIELFKGNIFYFIFFRLIRRFLNSPVIIKIHNFRVYASNIKNKTSHALIHKCGFDDKNELKLIKYISKIKKIFFIDCGCNFGFYSLFTASLSKKNVIKSFEASLKTINDFKKNIKLNNFNNIEEKYFAISNKSNEEKIFYESMNDWESSITHNNFLKKKNTFVQSTTIDSELKNINLAEYFLFIKLDIEGHEFNALSGCVNTIDKYDIFFQIELSRYNLNNKEFNFEFFKDFLKKYNYCIYNTDYDKIPLKQVIQNLKKLDKLKNTIGNYYLVKKNSKAEKYLNLINNE
ncbi:FkbM family methyltransferase [Candidatus Pelagibacter sp.]|nr:FkbM family methyltransferase [Candidatus Pelagibacter sp.]